MPSGEACDYRLFCIGTRSSSIPGLEEKKREAVAAHAGGWSLSWLASLLRFLAVREDTAQPEWAPQSGRKIPGEQGQAPEVLGRGRGRPQKKSGEGEEKAGVPRRRSVPFPQPPRPTALGVPGSHSAPRTRPGGVMKFLAPTQSACLSLRGYLKASRSSQGTGSGAQGSRESLKQAAEKKRRGRRRGWVPVMEVSCAAHILAHGGPERKEEAWTGGRLWPGRLSAAVVWLRCRAGCCIPGRHRRRSARSWTASGASAPTSPTADTGASRSRDTGSDYVNQAGLELLA
ncbi:uncharacterized protein LOC117095996 isoform X2 [Trachypithecus francoisi]|uniref:uncharacterized protein LOC117095996 isoform X2 n=1 Tax=Trachypithecus francoisi TaxID=54180 RepID=UPI00141BA4AA|nr:uncharacterized protein LOC117095996 isoform X2 [Trachypithecus francoisi]